MNTKYGPRKINLFEENRYVMPLSETSLNRLRKHGENGMIILSACRSEVDSSDPGLSLRNEFEKDAEFIGGLKQIDSDTLYDFEHKWLKRRNQKKDQELQKDIRQAGYSYTPVYGGYHGQDDVQSSYEPSYVVYSYDRNGQPTDFQALVEFGLEMCKKYHQESIYVQAPGKAPVYLSQDGSQINSSSSDDFKYNRDDQEYFTTTSRDKNSPQRFTADIVFENAYIDLRPASYNEQLRRDKSGEFIL